jgi:hypothetical protein
MNSIEVPGLIATAESVHEFHHVIHFAHVFVSILRKRKGNGKKYREEKNQLQGILHSGFFQFQMLKLGNFGSLSVINRMLLITNRIKKINSSEIALPHLGY